MPVPWEISALLAAAALLTLAAVAGLMLIEARRTLRNVTELSAAAERHLPAIRQNIDEIHRNAAALTTSLQALTRRASATGQGFDGVSREIRLTVNALESGVIEPGLRIVKVLSTLLAFGTAIRRIRRSPGLVRMRKKGRA